MDDKTFDGFDRREFLAMGPAVAVSSGVMGSAASARPLALTEPNEPAVSIAYWEGSDAIEDFDRLSHACAPSFLAAPTAEEDTCAQPARGDLRRAEDLWAGDSRFARDGAQVRIHGLFTVETIGRAAHPPLAIDVYFTPHHTAPFHAWRIDRSLEPSSHTAFFAPVDEDGGLSLAFTIGASAGDEASVEGRPETQVPIQFVLGDSPGQPKLRRGIYFLTWRDRHGPDLPSWRWYQVLLERPEDRAQAERAMQGSRLVGRWTALPPRDLTYVMISVDYGRRDAAEVSAV